MEKTTTPRSRALLALFLMAAVSPGVSACAESGLGIGSDNVRAGVDAGPGDRDANDSDRDTGSSELLDTGNGGSDLTEMDMSGADTGTADSGPDVGEEDGGDDVPDDPCQGDPSSQGWEAVGASISALPDVSNAMTPSVAVDTSCRIVVAFHEETETTEENIFVYRWDGSDWNALGGSIDASGQDDRWTTGVQVATYGDVPYIAWAEIKVDGEVGVFVARWDGTEWQFLEDVPVGNLLSFRLGLSIDSMERPVVSWNANEGLNTKTKVHVARYESGVWTPIGGPLEYDTEGNLSALAPSLIHDTQGRPTVAWQEGGAVHARRWETPAWNDFVGAPIESPAMGSAFDANLALAPNGDLVVGWREAADGATDVHIQRWDGAGFAVVADALDVEDETGGRTNTGNLALQVDSQDRTVFTFDEPQPDGPLRVHVFRHDGGGLAPLGAGVLDAVAGDTDGNWPAISVDPRDRAVVAWQEDRGDGMPRDIHVWRYTD